MGEKPMTDPMELVGRLEKLSALEPGWYANVGKRTGEQCCTAMSEAAACIRELVGWRPIETAPRDGTEIVAWDGSDRIICHWHGSSQVSAWVTEWETVSGYDVGWNKVLPTHWLPLPPAPGAEA